MNKKKIKTNKNHGITLIALIITVIVLLILAGTAISIAVNGGDLFGRAQNAVTEYNSKVAEEEQKINDVWSILEQASLIGKDPSGANAPVVPAATEKLEVYYLTWRQNEETGVLEEVPSETEPTTEWYNYKEGKWANIKTVNAETENEAYWVWIPRYAYKVPVRPTEETYTGNPTFEIAFLGGTGNSPVISSELNGATIKTDTTNGVEIGDWVVHPAFNFGGTQLKGIWVAKFEASSSNTIETGANPSSVDQNQTSLQVNVKPSSKTSPVWSWTDITVDNIFTVSQNMKNAGGALEENTSADPHMMKNVEWGAVAYLTQSKYGQMRTGGNGQVYINNFWPDSNSSYAQPGFGGAGADTAVTTNINEVNEYNTTNGAKASTTGNVYGIYDMSGGAIEYVAAYVTTVRPEGNTIAYYADVSTVITNLKNSSNAKYVDVYEADNTVEADSSANTAAKRVAHYAKLVNGDKILKYGDAAFETSYSGTGSTSWQKDYSYFPHSLNPVFMRGGSCSSGSDAGMFCFSSNKGSSYSFIGFRPVFVVK